ncbi:DNA-binding protein [Amycolatopsis sp. K13G38]|uniref:DNA-binding protein n=1 Tax=Amycolatopsis acididurans TaxID=2724524 RepID=A0ABX1J0B8_9PSEU|nr:OB-fold domain-containing protein [Amycolatopsis acididurans]NKQ52419.1 DNA-binding protein [Amycolatopsis acididurans]
MTSTLPAPVPTPETEHYWRAAAEGVLALQRCTACGWLGHRGRQFCAACTGEELEWFAASGEATLYSYVIVERGEGAFAERTPYAVAIVELVEGPRMITNVVGVEQTPEALVLDMPLRVTFERRGEHALPVFEPAAGGAG